MGMLEWAMNEIEKSDKRLLSAFRAGVWHWGTTDDRTWNTNDRFWHGIRITPTIGMKFSRSSGMGSLLYNDAVNNFRIVISMTAVRAIRKFAYLTRKLDGES